MSFFSNMQLDWRVSAGYSMWHSCEDHASRNLLLVGWPKNLDAILKKIPWHSEGSLKILSYIYSDANVERFSGVYGESSSKDLRMSENALKKFLKMVKYEMRMVNVASKLSHLYEGMANLQAKYDKSYNKIMKIPKWKSILFCSSIA